MLRDKLKNIAGDAGSKRRRITAACTLIVLALVMFFGAMFMPFQYFSNRSVLHTVSVDDERDEEVSISVTQTERVHQSLFRVFEAASTLGAASRLHAAATGFIEDYERYDEARKRLAELREEYQSIRDKTVKEAAERGVDTNSAEFTRMFADNLSDMNLIALDMLETAFTSDNSGAYEVLFGGIVLALIGALINLMIMITAIVAGIFGAVMLVSEHYKAPPRVFMTILTVMSAVGMVLCVFNPLIPPAAGPLALACIAVSVFYVFGLVRALTGGDDNRTVIRNAAVGALVPASMLCLAAMPSLALYVKGLGEWYLFYPGTLGTVLYSRIDAITKIGIKFSATPVTTAFVLGGVTALFLGLCSVKALRKLYGGGRSSVLFTAMIGLAALAAVALMIAVAATSARFIARGELVEYISGASWYVAAIVNALVVTYIVIDVTLVKRKGGSAAASEGSDESDGADDEKPDCAVSDEQAECRAD